MEIKPKLTTETRTDAVEVEKRPLITPEKDVYVPLSERTLPAKIGHGIKSIFTSNALWNGVRITTSSLAIMGMISLGPLGITAVAAGLALMVISMGMDTAHTRTLRKLDQELSLLQEHAKLSQEQENVLQAHPELASIVPKTENTYNTSQLGIGETRLGAYGLRGLSTGRPLLSGALSIADTVITNLAQPIIQLIVRSAFSLLAFSLDVKYQKYDLPATKQILRDEIIQLRKTTPNYHSLRELKTRVKEQYARTNALRKSAEPKNAGGFYFHTVQFEKEYDKSHQKPFLAGVKRFLADFFHSQQPFSDFNNLDWIHDRVELRKRS